MTDSRLRTGSLNDDNVRDRSATTYRNSGGMDGSMAVHPAIHVDLSRPRHDQSAYWGRARHFMETVNPLNIFATSAMLEEAARVVQTYK